MIQVPASPRVDSTKNGIIMNKVILLFLLLLLQTQKRFDIPFWFVRTTNDLGACCFVSAEDKPNFEDQIEREAQAEMYTTSNIQNYTLETVSLN